ncbi:hypothetical protein ACFVZD_43250 [Streptomyces sp. NPDC058287]|uniref:hypothetical protein n=1 Tax=unclassified Streptomyces TaxID=2593676 RepID=UPI0036F136F1
MMRLTSWSSFVVVFNGAWSRIVEIMDVSLTPAPPGSNRISVVQAAAFVAVGTPEVVGAEVVGVTAGGVKGTLAEVRLEPVRNRSRDR